MCFIHAGIRDQETLVDVRTGDAVASPTFGALALVSRLCIDTLAVYRIAAAIVGLTFVDIKACFSITWRNIIKKNQEW